MTRTEIGVEAAKAAPPAVVVASNKLLGLDLPTIVALATLLYLVIQIAYLIWKWRNEAGDRRKTNQPVDCDRRRQKGSANRVLVTALALSAAGFGAWVASEGSSPVVVVAGEERMAPHIPTQGDVPTIGHGSTRYEDGRPVRLTDPPITRVRAEALARNLLSVDERRFQASIPGVALYQAEYDLYIDFVGQYGIGNWRSSSMRRYLLSGEYVAACHALLRYRFAAGFDCSTPGNRRCAGVWDRQKARHRKCMEAQG